MSKYLMLQGSFKYTVYNAYIIQEFFFFAY